MMKETSETIVATTLTPPMSLQGSLSHTNDHGPKQPNFVTRIFNLFRAIRPGSDLTRFQLPPQLNMPKSQLQLYGESVYCSAQDLLSECVQGGSAVERFKAVVAWSISTTRPPMFGKAPYNPILGETHHVSRGNLNVLLEQVSHHPPISALHATDEAKKLEMTWWQHPVPRFYGSSVEITVHGERELKLLEFGETYKMNCPKLSIRLFPSPSAEWVGNVRVYCKETGLQAILSYTGKSLFGLKGSSTGIMGRISMCHPLQHLYEVEGNWDRTITAKEIGGGKTYTLYNAEAVISNLKTPIVQNPQGLAATESAIIWSEVSESILRMDWKRAMAAKRCVEENQRSAQKERDREGRIWTPKHFITRTDREGWEYWHPSHLVPPGPIVVPQ